MSDKTPNEQRIAHLTEVVRLQEIQIESGRFERTRLREAFDLERGRRAWLLTLAAAIQFLVWGIAETSFVGIHVEGTITDIGSVIRFCLIFGPVCVFTGMFAQRCHEKACREDEKEPADCDESSKPSLKKTPYYNTNHCRLSKLNGEAQHV